MSQIGTSCADFLFGRFQLSFPVQKVLPGSTLAAILAEIKKKCHPIGWGNAHATHARAKEAPLELVQETLRHKDITTTRRYVNANSEDFSGRYLGI